MASWTTGITQLMQNTKKQTVWFLITALAVGGTEETLVDLASNLDTANYDVTVWTIFDRNPLAEQLVPDVTHRTLGVSPGGADEEGRIIRRAADPTQYVRAPLRFARAVRSEQPDILQSFLFYDNVIGRLCGCLSPSTTIISGVRSVPTNPSWIRCTLDRLTIRLADSVVSNSEAGAQLAIDRGATSSNVSVIPNGRAVERFRDVAVPSDRLPVPTDATVVGTVGRLIRRKGHHDLLSAWPAIKAAHPDAHLVLVGDGPERERLESQASTLDCADSVHFLGFCDDIPVILNSLDLFVFPSHFEGLPGALIEAMAAGLPIVTTPVDGNSELVESYHTGLYVRSNHPPELSRGVSFLLSHPDVATTLGENAQTKATREYTIERMVTEFESLYRSLM